MILFDYNLNTNKQEMRDKWMTIPDMGYAIVKRYNVILVSPLIINSSKVQLLFESRIRI